MLVYLGIVGNKRIDYIAIKAVRIKLIKEKQTSVIYLKYSIRKGVDRKNSDSIEIYLKIRERKGETKYLVKKSRKINHYLLKLKKILMARFLQLKLGYGLIGQFFYKIKVLKVLKY